MVGRSHDDGVDILAVQQAAEILNGRGGSELLGSGLGVGRVDVGRSFIPARLEADAVLADTRWVEGAKKGFASARASAKPAILDADDPVPDDPALLGAATHLAFSADGLTNLTGAADLRDGLAKVRARTGAWCCATDGARGVLVADADGVRSFGAYKIDAVDTLGAGDVWHGAFALALGEGKRAEDAVKFASAAAALKVSRKGGRKGAPLRAEVEAFLKSQSPMEPLL